MCTCIFYLFNIIENGISATNSTLNPFCLSTKFIILSSSCFLETEKYAHVTFFFNGGVEKQFENEERSLVVSPKVATYDLDPPMSSAGVADKVIYFFAYKK